MRFFKPEIQFSGQIVDINCCRHNPKKTTDELAHAEEDVKNVQSFVLSTAYG